MNIPNDSTAGMEPVGKDQAIKAPTPSRERLPQRDLVKLEAIVSAHRELWEMEAEVAERLASAKASLGNIWTIASGLAGFAIIRVGRQQDDNWLVVMGSVILYFVASQTFRAWAAERDARHAFEDVRRRMWDMKYTWQSMGGTDANLGALYSIWTIDSELNSDSYRDGWSRIKADIAERIGL